MKYHKYAYYAYTAGVIDSDGTITIHKQPPRKEGWSPTYSLRIGVFQRDGRTVDFLVGFWGGRVHYDKSKEGFVWGLCNNKAENCLKKILPFLRYKKDQAQIAIEYRLFHIRVHKKFGNRKYPDSVLGKLEDYKQNLSALKHEYKAAKALATTKRDNSSEEEK